jgi:hypothetical protein
VAGKSEPAAPGGKLSKAEMMRRLRARRKAEREVAEAATRAEMLRQAGAREQLGLPLAPVMAQEPMAEAEAAPDRAGAWKRDTRAWKEFLLRRYRSPLVGLAEVAARPVAQLANELGCTRLEAFRVQMDALKELAPYLHQKMPTAVAVEGVAVAPLMIGVSQQFFAATGAPQGEAKGALKIVFDQGDSGEAAAPVGQGEV